MSTFHAPPLTVGERLAYDTGTRAGTIPGIVESTDTQGETTTAWIRLERAFDLDGEMVTLVKVSVKTDELALNVNAPATIEPIKDADVMAAFPLDVRAVYLGDASRCPLAGRIERADAASRRVWLRFDEPFASPEGDLILRMWIRLPNPQLVKEVRAFEPLETKRP